MKKRENRMQAVGLCSLITFFSVLCMCIFAAAVITSVQSDQKLADASYETVQAKYEAESRAEELLAQLRQGIVPEDAQEILQETAVPEQTVYQYTCPISEVQSLDVKVKVDKTNGSYEIMRWKIVSTADWEADDTLQLWDGE